MRVELHSHTRVSPCATISPDKLANLAAARGIDVLFVTDHDRIDAAAYLVRSAATRVIIGEEISTSDGDLLGLFLREAIPPGLRAEESAKRIKAQGGVVAIPHPCDIFRKKRFKPDRLKEFLQSGLVDCIEAWNSRNIMRSSNQKAYELGGKYGLPVFSASDSHTAVEVGKSGVCMDDFKDSETFLKALRGAELIREKSPLWVHGITKIRKTLDLLQNNFS